MEAVSPVASDSDFSMDDLSGDEGASRGFLCSKDVPQNRHHVIGDNVTMNTTAQEPQLSFFETLKLYPTALGYSVFFSLGIVMTAFDQQLLGSLFAVPAFQQKFGYEYKPGHFTIKASWQTALTMCGPLGQSIGRCLWSLLSILFNT